MAKVDVLYVVTTGLPGPGAGALVREVLESNGTKVRAEDGPANAVIAAADRACEFVELETAAGEGRGPSSGINWEDHPVGALKRLGPFVSLKQHQAALAEVADPSTVALVCADAGLSVTIELVETDDGPLLTLKPGAGTSLEGEMPGEYYLVKSGPQEPVDLSPKPDCGTCGDSGEVGFNPSPINDPQCADSASCPDCGQR